MTVDVRNINPRTLPKIIHGHRAPQAAIDIINALYEQGYSARQIEEITWYSYRLVARHVKGRSRHAAAVLRQPLTSKHWRTTRESARHKMENHLGRKLDYNEIVHHRDGDYTNNDLSNLEVMDRGDHMRHHLNGKKRDKAGRFYSGN